MRGLSRPNPQYMRHAAFIDGEFAAGRLVAGSFEQATFPLRYRAGAASMAFV